MSNPLAACTCRVATQGFMVHEVGCPLGPKSSAKSEPGRFGRLGAKASKVVHDWYADKRHDTQMTGWAMELLVCAVAAALQPDTNSEERCRVQLCPRPLEPANRHVHCGPDCSREHGDTFMAHPFQPAPPAASEREEHALGIHQNCPPEPAPAPPKETSVWWWRCEQCGRAFYTRNPLPNHGCPEPAKWKKLIELTPAVEAALAFHAKWKDAHKKRECRWRGRGEPHGWTYWTTCSGECHGYSEEVLVQHRDLHEFDSPDFDAPERK